MSDPLLRNLPQQNWLTLILLGCFLIACLAEFTSSRGMIRSWIRYSVKIDSMDNFEVQHRKISPSLVGRLLIFVTTACLIISIYKIDVEAEVLDPIFFLQNMTIVASFYLIKFYTSKLAAHVTKLELAYNSYQNLKSYHYGLLGYGMLTCLILYQYSPFTINDFHLWFVASILFAITALLILYRSRNLLKEYPYQFILYLCALEIGPYLLLYKYFIV